jgi:hypothetical protein
VLIINGLLGPPRGLALGFESCSKATFDRHLFLPVPPLSPRATLVTLLSEVRIYSGVWIQATVRLSLRQTAGLLRPSRESSSHCACDLARPSAPRPMPLQASSLLSSRSFFLLCARPPKRLDCQRASFESKPFQASGSARPSAPGSNFRQAPQGYVVPSP